MSVNPYQAALGMFWSVYVLSQARVNKLLLEEGTLQLSSERLASENINKILSELLDPGITAAPASSSAPASTAGAGSVAVSLLLPAGTASPYGPRWHSSYGTQFGPKPADWKWLKRAQTQCCACHTARAPHLGCRMCWAYFHGCDSGSGR